MAVQVSVD